MSIARADVVIPYFTGLPRDVSVNTFHFNTLGDWDEGAFSAIYAALSALYNANIAGNSISAFLANCVKRSPGALVKIYDLADPKPRTPLYENTFSLTAAAWAGDLPMEVALCGSYQAVPLAGAKQARRRGRVFFGPFNTGALASSGSTSSFAVPHGGLITRISAGLDQLASTMGPLADVTWGVYSRVASSFAYADSGWVDNDFDTQRRRGPRATARTIWTAS